MTANQSLLQSSQELQAFDNRMFRESMKRLIPSEKQHLTTIYVTRVDRRRRLCAWQQSLLS